MPNSNVNGIKNATTLVCMFSACRGLWPVSQFWPTLQLWPTMPAKQKAVVPRKGEYRFESELSREDSKSWYWKIGHNSELKTTESKLQKLAHGRDEQGINFQSVRRRVLRRRSRCPQLAHHKSLVSRAACYVC